jgi:hypothetical protein
LLSAWPGCSVEGALPRGLLRLQRARLAVGAYGLGAAGFVGIIAGLNNLGLALAIAAVTLFAGW